MKVKVLIFSPLKGLQSGRERERDGNHRHFSTYSKQIIIHACPQRERERWPAAMICNWRYSPRCKCERDSTIYGRKKRSFLVQWKWCFSPVETVSRSIAVDRSSSALCSEVIVYDRESAFFKLKYFVFFNELSVLRLLSKFRFVWDASSIILT